MLLPQIVESNESRAFVKKNVYLLTSVRAHLLCNCLQYV